ncbi:integrase core domain-containing protein [Myxococcus sp. Y35]|uniref:integrase core domain-containing protein n=1 Tax=Pseudomyxococcus flavus TaxID=3115648 RepID=UPI003CEA2F1E
MDSSTRRRPARLTLPAQPLNPRGARRPRSSSVCNRSRHVTGRTVTKGRCVDNIFVERLWRSLKYEEVYLNAYADVRQAWAGVGRWLRFYNLERPHQALGYRTPMHVYRTGLIEHAA